MNTLLILALLLLTASVLRRGPSRAFPSAFVVGVAGVAVSLVFRLLAGGREETDPLTFRFLAGLPLLIALPAFLVSLWQLRRPPA